MSGSDGINDAREAREQRAFGEARSALQAPPSAQGWEALCHAIDELSGDAYARLEAYFEGSLEAWPAALRAVPPRWWAATVRGQHHPKMLLARHLHIPGELDHRAALALAEAPGLTRLAALQLGSPDRAALRHLISRGRWPELAFLEVRGLRAPAGMVVDLARTLASAPLTGLSLRACQLPGRALVRALGALPVERLRVLELSQNDVGAMGVELLCNRAHMLEDLRLDLAGLFPRELRALAAAPWLGQLHTLDVWRSYGDAEAYALLTSALPLERMRWLVLPGTHDVTDLRDEVWLARHSDAVKRNIYTRFRVTGLMPCEAPGRLPDALPDALASWAMGARIAP